MVKRTKQQKELLIFLLVTYGGTCLMGISIAVARHIGMDGPASTFYLVFPGMGVALAKMIVERHNPLLPKKFFLCVLVSLGFEILTHLIFLQRWLERIQIVLGVLAFVLLVAVFVSIFLESKASRKAYGLAGNNWKATFLYVGLFLILLTIANVIFTFVTERIVPGTVSQFGAMLEEKARGGLFYLISVAPVVGAYIYATFLEEYGWRYYLQPRLQKKFGLIRGVLLLAVLWEIWHYPSLIHFWVTFDPITSVQVILLRLAVVVSLSVFIGFVYLKTNNIWAAASIHFLYNNFPQIINDFPQIIKFAEWPGNAKESWVLLLVYVVTYIGLFLPFLLTKPFRQPKERDISTEKEPLTEG